MPGFLHIIFGMILGLLLWKISESKSGEKRWNSSLIFIFAINNHFVPDFGGAIHSLGKALKSELIYRLGISIHGYAGWIFWALIYSVFWWGLLQKMEKKRELLIMQGKLPKDTQIRFYSFVEVYSCLLAAGFSHFFLDAIGHSEETLDGNYLRGYFNLLIYPDWQLFLLYLGLYLSIIISATIWLKRKNRLSISEIGQYYWKKIISKEGQQFFLIIGFAFLNVLIMYEIMASADLVKIKDIGYKWNDNTFPGIYFSAGNAISASEFYTHNAGLFYSVSIIVIFVFLFIHFYSQGKMINIQGKAIRGDLILIGSFVGLILCGYLIQPWIGNISKAEGDLGGFIFLWSTIISSIILMLSIKGNVKNNVNIQK